MAEQIKEFWDRDTTRIRQITASIFGNDEVLAYSVCKDKDDSISRAELYEGGAQPKRGGLVDSRLGAVNRNAVCGHCGLTSSTFDPGHFGHTVFVKRKFHIGFMPFVKSLLSVICLRCSKPYIQKHAPEMVAQLRSKKNSRARLAANKKLCKGIKHCPNCSVMVPKITTPKGAGARTTGSIEILAEYKGASGDDTAVDGKKKVVKILTADKCYEIFNNMDNDDCVLLGLDPIGRNHPKDLIIKILPYPPNTIRPSVHMESASDATREDQMTHKLSDILKNVAKESKQRGDTELDSASKAPDLAQFHYATYLDNGSVAMPRSEQKGAPTKSIRDRIRAKTGRVRYNLMGKRVNFSGRSVITPDPNIDVSELGVPQRVCMRLTYAVTVTIDNIGDLRDRVKNGVDRYPGATFVVPVINGAKQRPKFLNLKGLKREVLLNIGDIVHRHLQNGDIVLFNRQPTLHRQSMMAHFVRVLYGQWASFRMNVSVCQPYNADFDGDEMNIHVPQNEQTEIEILVLACVTRQLISPGKCKPLVGTTQDQTLAIWLMSDDAIQLDSRTAMNIMAHSGLPYSKLHALKQNKTYSGKQLLSMLMIQEINCVIPSAKGKVEIIRGRIQEPGGNLPKAAFGSVKNGILHQAWHEVAHQGTAPLLDRVNHVGTRFMQIHSFSAGSGDLEIPKSVDRKMDIVIATELLEVNHLITEAETSTAMQEVAVLEPIIQGKLDSVREIVGKAAVAALGKDNAFNTMEAAGSKGSFLNTAQMTAAVGQQSIEGKRVVKRVYGRALHHFYQNDDSGPARGFVINNYTKGLTPYEFIFHMMAGREGSIDTAIKTAETGYIQRRLVKAMEDLMVNYDGTVRTAGGALLQPLYGYNGVNPIYQSQLKIGMMLANDADLHEKYCFTESECKKHAMTTRDNESYYQMMLGLRNTMRTVQQIVSRNAMILNDTVTSPINFAQLIRKFVNSAEDYPDEKPIDARYVMGKITAMLTHDFTPMMRISKKELNTPGCVKLKDEELAKTFLRIIFHEYLAPKRVLVEYKLGRERFDAMCDEALERFQESTVAPGEMIGTIGAQSVGEPCTQLVLNSVDWHEQIVVRMATGERKIVKIGQWIDDQVEAGKKRVQNMEHEQVYLDTNAEEMSIMSIGEDGTTGWKKIEAITRHLPMNKDGTSTLLKVCTAMGREVTATKAKSFLIADGDKIVPIEGSKLKVGMRIPLVHSAPIKPDEIKTHLNMELYFPKTEYIWGTDMAIAKKIRDDGQAVNEKYKWFKLHNGKDFTIPYSRLDTAGVVMNCKQHHQADSPRDPIVPGCICTKVGRHMGEFPEQFPLDREFGFLVGAYLAEGCVTDTYISIVNNDKDYRKRVEKFCDTLNIGTHHTITTDKIQKGWTSSDIRIHSVMFARFFAMSCGRGSENKFVPDWAFNAPDEFVKGLLDGYFSGDGCVAKPKACQIDCSSVSKQLILGIQQLLFRYEIVGRLSDNRSKKNNRGTLPENILRTYILTLRNAHARSFARQIPLQIAYKQNRLNQLHWNQTYNGINNKMPYQGEWILRDEYQEKILKTDHKSEKFSKMIIKIDQPVYYDEVVSITEVEPSKRYVYDLTVADTRTFVMLDGFSSNDTFHSAGVSAKGIGNLGVPRIRELLGGSKNPKTPRTIIQLQEEFQNRIDVAQMVASTIRYTIMEHITKYVEVLYDPEPMSKDGWMQRDNATNIFHAAKCQTDISGLPWLMRIVLNREGMLNTGVQLLDIKAKFCAFWANRIKETKKLKRKEEKQVMDKITRVAILSNYSTSDELVIHIRYDTTAVNYSSHVAFCDVIQQRLKLKGIEGLTGSVDVIEDMYKTFDSKGAIVEKKRYAIVTEGVNLLELRYLNCIDLQKTTTNHVVHITMVMGIEASRASLKREFKTVLEDADYRHLCLLADLSTNSGDLVPIDRHGMMKFDADFLAKATNETTVEQLLNSAFFGDVDNMNNVSSRIMTGMAFNGGGNMAKMFVDFNELQKSEYLPEDTSSARSFTALTENQAIDDILRETAREEEEE
jgi:DNA-directed RNA polymerase II subunit RPB1